MHIHHALDAAQEVDLPIGVYLKLRNNEADTYVLPDCPNVGPDVRIPAPSAPPRSDQGPGLGAAVQMVVCRAHASVAATSAELEHVAMQIEDSERRKAGLETFVQKKNGYIHGENDGESVTVELLAQQVLFRTTFETPQMTNGRRGLDRRLQKPVLP